MYALFVSLIIMLLVAYWMNGRNVFSPWIISIFMHLLTVSVYILSKDYFQYEIHNNTVIYILTALLALGFGELVANAVQKRCSVALSLSGYRGLREKKAAKPIIVKTWFVLFVCAAMLFVFVWYFLKMYRFSLLCGNPGSYLNATKYVRDAIMADPELTFEMGTLLTQSVLLSELLSYAFCYLFFYNRIRFGVTKPLYLVPTLIYALQTICSTGRSDILYLLVVVCVCAFVFMKEKVNWSSKNDGKIIRIGVIAIVIFLAVFRLLGYLTEVSEKYGMWENFSRYISASMVGTDMFFQKDPLPHNEIFAQDLLKNVYAVLRSFGISIPQYSNFAETYPLAVGTSNAYMSLCGFVRDFGVAAMYVMQFFVGFIYANLIYAVRKGKCSMKRVLWLGILFTPIALSSIANIYSLLIGISAIYKAVYIYVLEQALVKNRFGLCKK